MGEEYEKYLEENYDAGKEKDQAKADSFQAARIEAQAKKLESEKRNELLNAAIDDNQFSPDDADAIEELYSSYGDNRDEYLMDGAILTCNMATTDVQIIRGTVFGTGGTGVQGEKKYTKLSIPISVSETNGLNMATVKNHEKGEHILPFECNCLYLPDRDWEMEEIFEDIEACKKFGTCRKLMQLEDDWENMIKEASYQTFDTGEGEQAEGVTMMSMLFCSHGGLITPVTSGQIVGLWEVSALVCTGTGEHAGSLTDDQKEINATFIYNYLTNQGWSLQAICGLLGNIEKECGMNPGAWQVWESKNGGYGLVQFSPATNYLDSVGLTTFEETNEWATKYPQALMVSQLKYIVNTMQDGRGIWITNKIEKFYAKLPLSYDTPGKMTGEEYMKSACDAGDLALVFHACYERSGDGKEELQERVDAAYNWYKYFN